MIYLVNIFLVLLIALLDTREMKQVRITSTDLKDINNCKLFIYSDGTLKKEGDHVLLPNVEHFKLDLKKEYLLQCLRNHLLFIHRLIIKTIQKSTTI